MHWLTILVLFHVYPFIFSFNENFKAELICSDTHMIVYLSSKIGDFSGIVYTEGSYQTDGCHLDIDQSRKILFEIPYGRCLTKEENGVYSNVVIIQRHPRILTNEDAAFLIKCDESNMMHKAQVIVTETMMTISKKKDSEGSDDYYKPQMKHNLYDKKTKTLYNDKETITFVGSRKTNTSSTLIVAKQ